MAIFTPQVSWQVPPAEASETYKLGWIDSICEDGANWNESQPGYSDWKKSLEILNGTDSIPDSINFRNYASGRRLRTNVRTAKDGLGNIRPMWGFTGTKSVAKYAEMLNKTSRALYLKGHWGSDIKDCLAYAMATNTGWIRPVYRRPQGGMGKGEIFLFTYGQPCILPFQMPSSGDYNDAYAVTLMDEWPIWEAHSRFPLHQDRLKPTSSQLWYSQDIRGAAQKNANKRKHWSPFTRRESAPGGQGIDKYIPMRFTTINDIRVNDTGRTIMMGQEGTPWYYEVPAYGSEIIAGVDGDGNPKYRQATDDDARMYPFRRLIISSEKCILYDGPAFNWHGQLDLIPMTVDRWPWAPGGFSLVHDGYNIQKNIDKLDKGMIDRLVAQNNLALAYNINGVTEKEASDFDPLDPENNRVGYDGDQVDRPFEMPIPMEWYKIESEMLAKRKDLCDDLDYTMQMRDIVELQKAKILGKDMENAERNLSSLGPIVKGIGQGMEESVGRVGDQVGWLIPQYMTSAEIMGYIGPESMDPQVFDYQPNDLFPSHLPDESVHDPGSQQQMPSRYSRYQRALWMRKQVHFVVMPNSLHELHQTATLLNYMQLKQRQCQISDYTIMETARVPNIERPEGSNEQEMWRTEQEEKISFEARKAIITKDIADKQGLGGDPGGGKQGGKPKGGRPPTAQAAPHQEVKGDGRPVVSESK